MQTHKSWMKKGTKSKYDKTHIYSSFLFSFMTYGFAWFSFVIFTLCSFFHSWLMALQWKETKSKYDKTKPCKAISHEWEKKQRVNMTKLNHAFMTYGFAWFSFVIFTLCSFFHSWLMALHGLVLSYLLFVSFLIHDLWVWNP
jgi:hypothetical protein